MQTVLRVGARMMRLSDNPPALFPECGSIHQIDAGPWWVAHTKSRFEKATAFDLLNRRIPYFLPMVRRTIISGGKKRQTFIPLFPSYVFFAGGAEQRYAALRTGRVAQVIEVVDQQKLIGELSSLHRAILAHAPLCPCPLVRAGQRCRIMAGPFQGIEGVVLRNPDSSIDAASARIIMEVSLLGQGASMEIDAHLLEPVEAHALQLATAP